MLRQYSSVKHVQPIQLFCFSNQWMMSLNTVTPWSIGICVSLVKRWGRGKGS